MIVDALKVKYYVKVVAVCQPKEVPLFVFLLKTTLCVYV